MRKILIIVLIGAIVLCLAGISISYFCRSCKKYDLILITIDTLRADHLSCYGYNRQTTPNIDKLAENGILFKNAYTQFPVTLPSHTSIMTSLYPATHGIKANFHPVDDSFITLAEILKKNSYENMAIVSAFCLNSKRGLNQGFDIYLDTLNSDRAQRKGGEVTDLASVLIERLKRPLFAWLHYFDPHSDYRPPRDYQDLYKEITPKQAKELNKLRTKIVVKGGKPNEAELEKLIALYDGEIRYVDDQIGKLLDLLKRLNLMRNTIIVITADHGEGFEHDYFFDHGDRLYEEQLRVPLIIWGPEKVIPKGKIVYDTVRLIDIMPTLLDLLDIKDDDYNFQGTTLLPAIKGDKALDLKVYSELVFREKFPQAKSNMVSLRKRNWKLIVETDDKKNIITGPEELYDIAKDPSEESNQAQVSRDILSELRNDISSWIDIMSKSVLNSEGDDSKDLDIDDEEVREKIRSLGYMN